MSSESNVGWLTVHEVLDITRLPYQELMAMADDGRLATRDSGGALLFDPEGVDRLAAEPESEPEPS